MWCRGLNKVKRYIARSPGFHERRARSAFSFIREVRSCQCGACAVFVCLRTTAFPGYGWRINRTTGAVGAFIIMVARVVLVARGCLLACLKTGRRQTAPNGRRRTVTHDAPLFVVVEIGPVVGTQKWGLNWNHF